MQEDFLTVCSLKEYYVCIHMYILSLFNFIYLSSY